MKRLLTSFFVLLFSFAFITAEAQTTQSGGTEALAGFARAVDVSDGSVFIGEPANVHQSGLVYIYGKTDGKWSQEIKLSASDGDIGDGFGSALSANGDRLLVGAPQINEGRGAAYFFQRAADGSWSQAGNIALSDTSAEGELGASVALSNNLAFVGAPEERDGNGAVYVYQQASDGSWSQQAQIANPDTTKGVEFGSALAVNGNRLVVGAPDGQGGAVYVYQGNDNGSWKKQATLANDRVGEEAGFGATLGLHKNEILVGAPGHAGGSGAVFVYHQNANKKAWTSKGQLNAYDSGPRFSFGASIAYAGNNVWIGAPNASDGKGALYQFERADKADGWASVSKVGGPDRKESDRFAGTVAVEGNVAVAGLVGADHGAGTAAIMEQGENGTWAVQTKVLSGMNPVLQPITGNKVECSNGKADRFGCNNMNLLSFLPIKSIGGDRGVSLNDIWGWTDPKTDKEYALVGRIDGTSFVDVSDPSNPVYVGTLPMPDSAEASSWRDIKVYENHAYIVADNANIHGMQVVDLTKLRDYDGKPMKLSVDAHYNQIHSAHNVVINQSTGFAYVVGSSGGGQTCGGGLHMVNIQDPTNPTFAGCFADPSTGRSGTGYTHDAQCVTYHGPDEEYKGQEICFGANETAVSIADVTDKKNPKAISTASYPDYAYVHQGWLTEDHRYFFQNDELDELSGNVEQTRTLIWDVTDLDDPQLVKEFMLDNPSTDHNLYIKDGTMFQSNYVSGLQVLDVSDPANPVKVGHFDTEPFNEDAPGFAGTWSNYPFFESGTIIMTSMQEGLFILQQQEREL